MNIKIAEHLVTSTVDSPTKGELVGALKSHSYILYDFEVSKYVHVFFINGEVVNHWCNLAYAPKYGMRLYYARDTNYHTQ
jgi:hypothetical protein